MRIGELLRRDVVDVDGRRLGSVDDVRLVQDGPMLTGFGQALRVDGLVVGRGGVAVRLGYARHQVKGPWLLKRTMTALETRAWFVPVEAIEDWGGDHVRLSCRADEVARLGDVV